MIGIPQFTGSLDARVPAENVVLVHYLPERDKWLAVSQGSDGSVHYSLANTEPLARRAAGLRTLHHLQEKAEGRVKEVPEEEVREAQKELARELDQLAKRIRGSNSLMRSGLSNPALVAQVHAARETLLSSTDKGMIAKWTLPVLLFVAAAFAEGSIGVLAEACLEKLGQLLGG